MKHVFGRPVVGDPSRKRPVGTAAGYLIAIGTIALATLIRFGLDPVLGPGTPYSTYFAGALFVAWFAGIGPAVVVAVLGGLAGNFLFVEPRNAGWQHLQSSAEATRFVLYLFLAGLAITILGIFRRARLIAERQRETFRITLTSIGDAVIVTDEDALVRFMNATAEALCGWTTADAWGKPLGEVFNIVNEETRKIVESPVTKAIRVGAVVGLANHTILIARDGTEYHIDDSAAPIRDNAENIVGVVLVFRDIGERRVAEKAIAASETRYRRLFEAAHDGILILDAQSKAIIDVNRFMTDLVRQPREYFLGKQLWQLGLYADVQKNEQAMQLVELEGAIRYQSVLSDRDGRRVPVDFVCNIYTEDQKPVIQCNIRDNSERKRYEDEREANLINQQMLRMEAENANRAKDLFLATLSHEMRTPLNAIVGWMNILRREGRDERDLEEGLDVIERNTKAQVQLIEDVLDVSRIVSGKLRLEIRPLDLSVAINAGINTVRPAADAKEIRIEVETDPSASKASGDAGRIQQIVWNLISNAVKFSPKGGRIGVRLSREKSNVRLDVSDNGVGMSPDFLPYVFDRFRQADSSTRRKYGGLGLGLSIVKHLVEAHGGTVEALSEGEGKGSTFTVRLPIRAMKADKRDDERSPGTSGDPDREEQTDSSDAPFVRLDGMRVLVVDDEADARRLLSRFLQHAGATVIAAASAREALEILSEVKPEILISDLGMPDEDGFDLIRKVRAQGHHPRDLPAVALTAFVGKDDQRAALLAGFQVHVPKPVDPRDLTAVIASLTGRTR